MNIKRDAEGRVIVRDADSFWLAYAELCAQLAAKKAADAGPAKARGVTAHG